MEISVKRNFYHVVVKETNLEAPFAEGGRSLEPPKPTASANPLAQ